MVTSDCILPNDEGILEEMKLVEKSMLAKAFKAVIPSGILPVKLWLESAKPVILQPVQLSPCQRDSHGSSRASVKF